MTMHNGLNQYTWHKSMFSNSLRIPLFHQFGIQLSLEIPLFWVSWMSPHVM